MLFSDCLLKIYIKLGIELVRVNKTIYEKCAPYLKSFFEKNAYLKAHGKDKVMRNMDIVF